MKLFEYDARINLCLRVEAEGEPAAETAATDILERLVITDPVTGRIFRIDTEDGVELVDEPADDGEPVHNRA